MENFESSIVNYIQSTKFEKLSKEVIDSVQDRILDSIGAVSYTHLTLPTNREV